LAERGIEPVIPPRSNRKVPIEYDREAYKRRNLIERCVNRLKQFRRIATRYEKTARSLSFDAMYCVHTHLDQNCQRGLARRGCQRVLSVASSSANYRFLGSALSNKPTSRRGTSVAVPNRRARPQKVPL
jgi:hypothetical protein